MAIMVVVVTSQSTFVKQMVTLAVNTKKEVVICLVTEHHPENAVQSLLQIERIVNMGTIETIKA